MESLETTQTKIMLNRRMFVMLRLELLELEEIIEIRISKLKNAMSWKESYCSPRLRKLLNYNFIFLLFLACVDDIQM